MPSLWASLSWVPCTGSLPSDNLGVAWAVLILRPSWGGSASKLPWWRLAGALESLWLEATLGLGHRGPSNTAACFIPGPERQSPPRWKASPSSPSCGNDISSVLRMNHRGPACPAGEGLTQEVHPWMGAVLGRCSLPHGTREVIVPASPL